MIPVMRCLIRLPLSSPLVALQVGQANPFRSTDLVQRLNVGSGQGATDTAHPHLGVVHPAVEI